MLKLQYKEQPQVVEGSYPRAEKKRLKKLNSEDDLVDKIRKYGVEKFRAITEDDPERAEFWLENTIRVLDELSCTPAECLKYVVSLLKDSTYQWWNTLIFVVPKKRVT